MTTTLHLADGTKVRSASRCRYVVVAQYESGPRIVRRSDNLEVARKAAAKLGRRYGHAEDANTAAGIKAMFDSGAYSTAKYLAAMSDMDARKVPVAVVFDQVTKEMV